MSWVMWFSLIRHQISWNYKVVFSKKPLFIWSFLNGISHCPRLNEFFPLELNKTESKIEITKCGRFFLTQLFCNSLTRTHSCLQYIFIFMSISYLMMSLSSFVVQFTNLLQCQFWVFSDISLNDNQRKCKNNQNLFFI